MADIGNLNSRDITMDIRANPRDITSDISANQRGTEKYATNQQHDKSKYGMAWYKVEEEVQRNKYPTTDENPNEPFIQDISSTAVLTPLEDDLVGNVVEVPERGNWAGRFDFLMSLLGYSVGLGNVWRFPYLAYRNGGGAFVFPFVIMLFLLGLPLMFLELAFGQYAGLGPAVIFERFCPLFHGLGYGMIFISAGVSLYYTVIIAWCIFYLVMSFRKELLWETCREPWATEDCYSHMDAERCKDTNGSLYYKKVCYNASDVFSKNLHELVNNVTKKHAPAQDYFERGVLHQSSGIEQIGNPQWPILICLFAAWTMIFLALSKGVKSTGKVVIFIILTVTHLMVVYFTALFPYVVLLILFFRGITLPGAKAGIMFYITPRFEELGKAQVWSDAAAQIFFALSPAWGGLITLASYNKFHNNCFRDTLVVSVGNIATSLFAGFVIFAIIGYLAQELNMSIDEVVDEGAGLAFIVYPDVVTRLPISPLWSILFFVMMITLGMGSEFAILETVITGIQDTFPSLREKKTWVVMSVCVIGFLVGIVITCEGGIYLLQLMDTYVSSWSVFIMAATESLIVGWVYGTDQFMQDIEMMIGPMSCWKIFFMIFWQFLSPFTLMAVLLFNLAQFKPLTLNEYKYPWWADAIGCMMALWPLIWIGIAMVWRIHKEKQDISLCSKIAFLLKPSRSWGPAHKVSKVDLQDLAATGAQKNIENPNFSSNDSVTPI